MRCPIAPLLFINASPLTECLSDPLNLRASREEIIRTLAGEYVSVRKALWHICTVCVTINRLKPRTSRNNNALKERPNVALLAQQVTLSQSHPTDMCDGAELTMLVSLRRQRLRRDVH